MRSRRIARVVIVAGLVLLSARSGAGQSTYVAGGVGPTSVLEDGLVGGGVVLDLSESDPVLTLGGGLRVQLQRLIFLFGEARLQTIPGSSLGNPKTILPITFGLGLGT